MLRCPVSDGPVLNPVSRRTSGRTQTEIDDAVAGLLDQATADTRYFVRAPGAESGSPTVQEQFTPRIVRNLLLEASLCRATPSSETKARCASAAAASWTKVEADSDARFLPTTWAPWTAGQQRAVFGADGHGGVLDLQVRHDRASARSWWRRGC